MSMCICGFGNKYIKMICEGYSSISKYKVKVKSRPRLLIVLHFKYMKTFRHILIPIGTLLCYAVSLLILCHSILNNLVFIYCFQCKFFFKNRIN